MLTLLRVDEVHAPEPTDANEILIADKRIAAVGRGLPTPRGLDIEVVELPRLKAVPGFIDQHAHVTGGGGEGGPGTRCPEIQPEDIPAAGITTVIGILGFDSISRSPADLLAKTLDIKAAGINAWMYTGAYRVPPPTLTGDIQRDLAWIPEVIGVGEVALSDHRSSQPTTEEIARIVTEARVGGMLAGKRGICHFHIGNGERGLDILRRVLSETEIPASQVIPTHINRRRALLEDAADYAKAFNAAVDITAFDDPGPNGIATEEAVYYLVEAGVPPAQITMSSDCNGSLPVFNEHGELAGMRVASNKALLACWQSIVRAGRMDFATALSLLSSNVARVLGLEKRKGRLAVGFDADITLIDADLKPTAVFARGKRIM
jgi:beta-aspartyl-dipeptidase (metallo-type)